MLNKKTKLYIADREIVGYRTIEKSTPLGSEMVELQYKNIPGVTTNDLEIMPKKRYDTIVTNEISDASTVYNKIVKEVGDTVYGLLHEYGVKLIEIDGILNDGVANQVNAAQIKASNILFGVDYEDQRTVNIINDVLIENYKRQNPNNDRTSS